MRILLAGGEAWWKAFERHQIRYVLFSYHYLRTQRDFGPMVDWMERAKRADPGCFFMLDSGAFTYIQGGKDVGKPLEDYADEYIKFLGDSSSHLFDTVAELDVYEDLMHGKKTVLDAIDRVASWRSRIYEKVRHRIVPVMHRWMPQRDVRDFINDPDYSWLGIASGLSSATPEGLATIMRMTAHAHRAGKKVHAFGMTRLQTDVRYLRDLDTVDSTTWLRADKYGGTFIWRDGHLRVLDHLSKEKRRWFNSYFKSIGLDPSKIVGDVEHDDGCPGADSRTPNCPGCKLQLEELRASSLIAWRNMAAWYDRFRARITPIDHGPQCSGEEQEIPGFVMEAPAKFRTKGWKGRGAKPILAEFAGFRCPHFRLRPKTVSLTTNCRACPNMGACQEAEDLERKVEDYYRARRQEIENPGGEATSSRGDEEGRRSGGEKATHSGGVHESDGRTAAGGEAEETGTGGTRNLESTEEGTTRSRVGSTDTGNVTGHDETSTPPGGFSKKVTRMRVIGQAARHDPQEVVISGGLNHGAFRREAPRVNCDSCAISGNCPKFKPASVCAYNAIFDQFDFRSSDGVLAAAHMLAETEWERTWRAIMGERLSTGGQVDPRVTAQMSTMFSRLSVLDAMMASRHGADPRGAFRVTADLPKPSDPTVPQPQGVLALLFAAPSGAPSGAGTNGGGGEEPAKTATRGPVIDATAREGASGGGDEAN